MSSTYQHDCCGVPRVLECKNRAGGCRILSSSLSLLSSSSRLVSQDSLDSADNVFLVRSSGSNIGLVLFPITFPRLNSPSFSSHALHSHLIVDPRICKFVPAAHLKPNTKSSLRIAQDFEANRRKDSLAPISWQTTGRTRHIFYH